LFFDSEYRFSIVFWFRASNPTFFNFSELYICPGLSSGLEVTIFRQTNGPIANISENEGSLHFGVCSGCQYWLRNRGRKIGDLVWFTS
jgi:hypothetical protein